MKPATTHRAYADRRAGGQALAALLRDRDWHEPVVLGIARGGVPVAAVVAGELDAGLDVVVARKIGAPGRPELGIGAVTAHGPPIYDENALYALDLSRAELTPACERERAEARRRVAAYQHGREPEELHGRDVIVVDDGLATGVTATAALRAVRERQPRRALFAAPVGAPSAVRKLREEADEVVCAAQPDRFRAVGQWYRNFRQTPDDEVVALLAADRNS
nr:phosphoribosyltransferase family protein [Amycolatopsis anabasis]